MIWRWLTFFSVAFGTWMAPPVPVAGTVSGDVELTNSHDPAVRKHKDYSGVVLWLSPSDRRRCRRRRRRREVMQQKERHFMPHVLAISVGSTVDFPNLDPIFHNAFSNFSGQPFDVGLYAPGTSRSELFKHPGIVRVFCNIHPTMSADHRGGDDTVVRRHSRYRQVQHRECARRENTSCISSTSARMPENLRFLERRITVPEDGLTLPLISISETGFIPAPAPEQVRQALSARRQREHLSGSAEIMRSRFSRLSAAHQDPAFHLGGDHGLFAITGEIVLTHIGQTMSDSLEEEVQHSFQAYTSLLKSRDDCCLRVSRILATMPDVRGAFSTGDQPRSRTPPASSGRRSPMPNAIFLVTDPRGKVIASLGGVAAHLARKQPRRRAAGRQAAFPSRPRDSFCGSGELYHISVTPVYVDSTGGPASSTCWWPAIAWTRWWRSS